MLRAEEQLQPRRPRPRDPGPAGIDRRRHAHARRQAGRLINAVSPTAGSTAAPCAPTDTRRTRARARAGPPVTPAAGPCTHALNAVKGCVGYPKCADRAKTWGFYDVLFKGKQFEFERPFGSYVMENVLFKISFPAEFHAQTAVECAMQLHPQVAGKLDQIERIEVETQEAGRPHHRQDRAARELRRPRPLPAVHGGRAADLRPPHRRRLQRRRWPPTRASTPCARRWP